VLTNNSKETPRLSYWALWQLAHALAPVPSGREVVLAMAQKNMCVLSSPSPYSHSSSKDVSFFESLPSTPSANSDALYLAIDCLCVLVEKCHPSNNSSEDDCGRKALGMLTDIIILQRPSPPPSSHTTSHVSIDVVSWMFCELNKSSRLGKFTKWVSQRLLRACFVGLLKFISLEESEPVKYSSFLFPGNILSRARNDVLGMLRLALSLYDGIAKSHENMHPSMTQPFLESHTLLKPHLLCNLLSQPDKPDKPTAEEASTQHTIDQLFKEGHDALQRGFDPSDESIGFAIDGIFLMIFIQGAARMIQKKRHGSPERVATDRLKNLNDYIYHAERYYYLQEDNASMMQQHSSPLPNWIEVQIPSINASKRYQGSIVQLDETPLNCVEFKLFHMSLCDILVEILLRNWAQHNGGVELDNHHNELDVLLGVNSILGSKRQVNQSVTIPSSSELLLGNMSRKSICSLFKLSSQHLRSLLSTSANKKDALPQLDMLVKNVLDLCKIQSKPTSLGISSQSRILCSFWSLYCSLADEESSQLLISLVKESYVEMGKWADSGTISDISVSSFSLLSITSSEELDYHVRYLRGVILSALSQVLTLITTS